LTKNKFFMNKFFYRGCVSDVSDAHCFFIIVHLSRKFGARRQSFTSATSGWRVGYSASKTNLFERLFNTKLLASLTTPALLEKALAWCIDQGQLRRHAERIRLRLDVSRTRSVKLAQSHGCTFAAEPAGLFGWVDTGVDTEMLAQWMLDEGYLLAPGALFHAARQPSSLMRINFATTQDAAFWKVFASLRDGMV
jgi:DNA-binding transcriptional MocR family regulator